MKRRIDALFVLLLGGSVVFLLLGPTLVGIAVDRAAGTAPWGLVMGTLLGVGMATIVVASLVLGQFQRLAPIDPKEDSGP